MTTENVPRTWPGWYLKVSKDNCIVRFGCDADTDSSRVMPTARETSKARTLRNTGPFVCTSCTRHTDGIVTKLLRCGIASEALRRNRPLSYHPNRKNICTFFCFRTRIGIQCTYSYVSNSDHHRFQLVHTHTPSLPQEFLVSDTRTHLCTKVFLVNDFELNMHTCGTHSK